MNPRENRGCNLAGFRSRGALALRSFVFCGAPVDAFYDFTIPVVYLRSPFIASLFEIVFLFIIIIFFFSFLAQLRNADSGCFIKRNFTCQEVTARVLDFVQTL